MTSPAMVGTCPFAAGLSRGGSSPATSARFRIEIDAFGRVVPKVVPVDGEDADASANDERKD